MNIFERELDQIQSQGLFRTLTTSSGLDFSSNDYLGLSRNDRIRFRLFEHIKNSPQLGSTGSRLLTGNSSEAEELESFLCSVFEVASALVFGSGYLANLAVPCALSSVHTEFFSDELNHASLIDGIRLTKRPYQIFRHNDLNDLEEKLKTSNAGIKAIVTESVFSMDGDLAPVDGLLELASKYSCQLVVDEAHALGVFGRGRFSDPSLITIHTCGKALGAYGAFVTGPKEFRDLLITKSRSFIYTTALPPYVLAHIRFALEEMRARPDLAAKLHENIQFFSGAIQKPALSAIVPVIVSTNEAVTAKAAQLQALGFDVRAIRSPTVQMGKERLRITLKAFHKKDDLQNLARHLKDVL